MLFISVLYIIYMKLISFYILIINNLDITFRIDPGIWDEIITKKETDCKTN